MRLEKLNGHMNKLNKQILHTFRWSVETGITTCYLLWVKINDWKINGTCVYWINKYLKDTSKFHAEENRYRLPYMYGHVQVGVWTGEEAAHWEGMDREVSEQRNAWEAAAQWEGMCREGCEQRSAGGEEAHWEGDQHDTNSILLWLINDFVVILIAFSVCLLSS